MAGLIIPLLHIAFTAAVLPAQTSAEYQPRTNMWRWNQYERNTVLSPGLYLAALGYAGGEQFAKRPAEWGQGVDAYGKRLGTFIATYAIQYSVQDGAAAAMGYDPHYIRCDCKGRAQRFLHAVVWSFLTENQEGRMRLNVPMVAGAYAGEIIPYFWFPKRFSRLKDGFRDGSQEVAITIGLNVFREFAPELRRSFRFALNP